MNLQEHYPTKEHRKAAKKIVETLGRDKHVKCILLMGSCARGKATKDSCLDICVIVKDKTHIKKTEQTFQKIYESCDEFKELRRIGEYSHVDLDVIDGKVIPQKREWTSGPDDYEVVIGNIFVYPILLFDRESYFKKIREPYIPYYTEPLRKKRLEEVKRFLFNNLNHIPLFVERGLYFQSFKRLYDASQEFLQALFIKNKVYPIAYDKWVKEQLVEMLKRPDIYSKFIELMQINNFESGELTEKAGNLKLLAEKNL